MSSNDEGDDDPNDEIIDRIEALFDRCKYSEVVDVCSKLLAEFPSDYRFYYHRAQAKMLSGDVRGAADDMTSAIAQNPSEPTLFYFRGLWALDGGDYRSAASDLQRAIEAETFLGTSYYVESATIARAVALLYVGDFQRVELECVSLGADLKTFAAGRQWTVEDVRAYASRRQRPQSG